MRVTGEGQKLGLKDVGRVSGVVADRLPPPLPVPHDDVEVVRAGRQPGNVTIDLSIAQQTSLGF